MSNNKKYGWFLAVVFSMMTFSQIAAAVPDCTTGMNLRFYNLGYLKGGNLLDQAWNGIDQDCYRLVWETDFKDAVIAIMTAYELPADASDRVTCHYDGFVNGLADGLAELEDICLVPCVQDGNLIGEIAAIFYCELAIAFDGLGDAAYLTEGLLTLCEDSMVEACESTFQEVTEDYGTDDSCDPYTEGEHDTEWQLAQHNQCVMNPDTDTDTDTDTCDTDDTDTDC